MSHFIERINNNLLIGINHEQCIAASISVPLGVYDRKKLHELWGKKISILGPEEVDHYLLVVNDGGTKDPEVFDDWMTQDA